MKKRILNQLWTLFLTIIFSVVLVSCNSKISKEKSLLILAPAEQVEKYQAAFKKHFASVTVIDNSKAVKIEPSDRYVLMILNTPMDTKPEPLVNAFLMHLYDLGNSVKINLTYTVGDKLSNPTVISSTVISGLMTLNNSLTFTPNETKAKNETERLETIALFIKETLISLDP